METLQINKANALTAYEQANDKGKVLLSNLFGKETFAKIRFKDYKDIKTLEDAIEYLGANDEFVKDLSSAKGPADVIAYLQLRVIAKALNGGRVMDWNNAKENKYYPWFNAKGASDGVSYYHCDSDHSYSHVGSRLCYTSSDRAIYAGKQFIEIYNTYING